MSPVIDKRRVADSFSRAAATYDSVAQLQRDIGTKLLDFLPSTFVAAEDSAQIPSRLLDLGCGTGYFGARLQQQFPAAELFNLDLAHGMLQYARAERDLDAHWLCADAEALPLASQSLDLIFSSLAIQWCANSEKLFAEIARVLRPGGHFVVATLGPDTLHELRDAWAAADSYTHVNSFVPLSALLDSLAPSLAVSRQETEMRVLQYQHLRELTDELKNLGAHNMNSGQQAGLTGRQQVRSFKQAYEARRQDNGYLPATYQVYYLVLTKQG